MTLGYISAFSETLAMAVIIARGVPAIASALDSESEDHIKAACAWTLGQIGRHSPDHAKTLAEHVILLKLLKVYTSTPDTTDESGADLRSKTQRAIQCILEKTLQMDALEPLLQISTPTSILKYVVAQFAKILPHDVGARRSFVTCGALQRIQEIAASYNETSSLNGTKLGESIRIINECYPEEIVRYFSPGYSASLLEKVTMIKSD
jgi:hypothetical protein